MKRWTVIILAVCVLAGVAAADGEADFHARRRGHPGDVASQLRLKLKLLRTIGSERVMVSLSHARESWEGLTPDQRERYRDQAMAFLRENPERQAELLDHYDKLIAMTPRQRSKYRYRAAWLKAVVEWLEDNDPDRVKALKEMAPADRAREFISLRDRLAEEGEITLPAKPSTRPAAEDAPTTRPADAEPTDAEGPKPPAEDVTEEAAEVEAMDVEAPEPGDGDSDDS